MKILTIVAAGILAVTAATAAHAQNQSCSVTVVKSGYQFHSLNASKNLSCVDANKLLNEALNLSYGSSPKGLNCRQTPSGSGGKLTCDAVDTSARHIDATWAMPSQRR